MAPDSFAYGTGCGTVRHDAVQGSFTVTDVPEHIRAAGDVPRPAEDFLVSPTLPSSIELRVIYVFTIYSAGKDIILRLLDKNELRRLGSASGASQVKQHKWFAKMRWGLLRNTTPPIVPATSNGFDAVNFRSIRESQSLQLEMQGVAGGGVTAMPGTPGLRSTEDGLEPPPNDRDLFGAFSSVTLKHDGEV